MDNTIWKPIPGWEDFYDASNSGLIRSKHRLTLVATMNRGLSDKILRPKFDKDCYLSVSLSKDSELHVSKRINQLIGMTFIPNPENKEIVDHINGVRWDNRVENLRWATNEENMLYAYDMGSKVKLGRPISQYDLSGNFIKSFRVIREVEKDGFNHKTVNKVILGQRKTAFGFLWKEDIQESGLVS